MNRPPKGDDYRRGNSPHMMFQPSANDTPNMAIKIRQGSFWVNNSEFVEYGGGTSPEIQAPRSGAKWVVVVINKLGTALLVNGVAKANNPMMPTVERNLLPVACVYVKSSTKVITNDMIYDVRPTLSVGGYPQQHNQLTKRDEPNSHTISSITGLEERLDEKLDIIDAKDMFETKADIDGTISARFVLNKDDTGVPTEFCGIEVNRGSLPSAMIRFNEDLDTWQYTNGDGLWNDFSFSKASMPLSNSFTVGGVRLNAEPTSADDPVAVGVNDPLYKSIAAKVSRSELDDLVTIDQLMAKLETKADVEGVYSKTDAEAIFVTKADAVNGNVGGGGGYTKTQLDDMFALKANAATVYSKTETDALLEDVYTKAEADARFALLGTGGGSGGGAYVDAYTKVETDHLLQQVAERSYNKDALDAKLALKADVLSLQSMLAVKADVVNTYTKAEVDALLEGVGGAAQVVDAYTKAEVDAKLIGKANSVHGHVAVDIAQDEIHRMVTDAQIASWDAKQNALGYVPVDSSIIGQPGGLAVLDATGHVPMSQLQNIVTLNSDGKISIGLLPDEVISGVGGATIIRQENRTFANYAEMLAYDSPFNGMIAYVADASEDPSVNAGWAEYMYVNGTYVKTGERESTDLVVDWSTITNKPETFAPDTTKLSGYLTKIEGYTKTEVDNKLSGYLSATSAYTKAEADALLNGKANSTHTHDDRYLTTAQVNALLNGKLDASVVDTTKIHDAAQLGTHIVDETNLADGRALVYDGTSGRLVYRDVATGGSGEGSGTTVDYFKLGTMTVDETGVKDGDQLVYDAANNKLVYADPASRVGTLEVNEGTVGDGKVLAYDTASNKLVYIDPPQRGTKEIDETNLADGRMLVYSATTDKLVYVDVPTASGSGSSSGSGSGSGSGSDSPTATRVKFTPLGATPGECTVCASSENVSFAKTGTNVALTPGADVEIYWVCFRLTNSEMATVTSASLDWNTGGPTDYAACIPPSVTIFGDDDGNRARVKNIAQNMNTNPHTIEFTGMAHRAYLIRVDL